MFKIIFDIARLQTKMFMAIILISLFTVMYMAIPRDEFHKVEHHDQIDKTVTHFDLVQYSLLSQVGIHGPVIYPKTIRARILTGMQLFLGYTLLLI
jgi:hypothetical protein